MPVMLYVSDCNRNDFADLVNLFTCLEVSGSRQKIIINSYKFDVAILSSFSQRVRESVVIIKYDGGNESSALTSGIVSSFYDGGCIVVHHNDASARSELIGMLDSDAYLDGVYSYKNIDVFGERYCYFDSGRLLGDLKSDGGTSMEQLFLLNQLTERYAASIGVSGAADERHGKRVLVVTPHGGAVVGDYGRMTPQEIISAAERLVPERAGYSVSIKIDSKESYPCSSVRSDFVVRKSANLGDLMRTSDIVVSLDDATYLESVMLGKIAAPLHAGDFCHPVKMDEVFVDLANSRPENRSQFLYKLLFDTLIKASDIKENKFESVLTRQPFSRCINVSDKFISDILAKNSKEVRSMIKIGRSKISKTASLDVTGGGSIVIGDDCEVRHHAVLECVGGYNGSIEIGNHCVIGVGNWLQGSGKIKIGNEVIIGPHVNIVSSNHSYSDSSIPVARQPLVPGEIVIEDDVWIGAGCTIRDGVKIGAHSIIGANSFVNKDVPPYSIVAGSPAKVVKTRK